MDNSLAPNDPYRGMNSGMNDIVPNFLKRGKRDGAAKDLKDAEKTASKDAPAKVADGVEGARQAENVKTGLFSGSGKSARGESGKKKKFGGKMSIKKMAPALALGALVFGLGMGGLFTPNFLIGTIDFNLQDSVGFSAQKAVLEKQAEYTTAEMMAEAKVPDGFANDLASNGIEVGQVTLAGEFIRTNTYIAGLDQGVASNGEFRAVADESGELVVRFKDKIIKASEFVAEVESNPEMYAAFAKASNISAKFNYSSDVSKVYKEMGVSRGNFNDWEATGNAEADQESFDELLAGALNSNANVILGGYDAAAAEAEEARKESGEESDEEVRTGFSTNVSGDMYEVVNKVAEETTGDNATGRAAELLNMALSAGEPYLAASTFVAIEEPIQRARIGNGGPVNELMNDLSKKSTVTYLDANTGEMTMKSESILETQNFAAAVGGGPYSKAEALSFSRDRILRTTGQANSSIVNQTTVATSGKKKTNVVALISAGGSADAGALESAGTSLELGFSTDNSEIFPSVVGGNRAVEGGSFIVNNLNMRVLGGMPSDASTIAAYNKEVDEILARQAEADRATRSPFDISSPNTFLGSIVHKFASALIRNGNTGFGSTSITASLNGFSGLAANSIAEVSGLASADGEDSKFTTLTGASCTTVNSAAGVEGDLYCTSHNTLTTKYMGYSKSDWVNSGIGVNGDGGVESGSELDKFIVLGMDRKTTVGVKSADVCNKKRNLEGDVIGSVGSLLSGWLGIGDACTGVDEAAATGATYSLSSGNSNRGAVELYAGYALHDTVYSLLEGSQSNVSKALDNYYARFPEDDSHEARIARISGLTVDEVKIAMNYADYIVAVARYDASTRHAFGAVAEVENEDHALVGHANKMAENYYVLGREAEYSDLRNRASVS